MTKSYHRLCTFNTVLERKRRRSGFSAEMQRREEKAQKWRAVPDTSSGDRELQVQRVQDQEISPGSTATVQITKSLDCSQIAVTYSYGRTVSSPPRPLLAVPNVTAHPSTASVPITVLPCNDPLLCGFNVRIKGLNCLWQLRWFLSTSGVVL